jgi:hypothetical protein
MSGKTQRKTYESLDLSGAVALGFSEKNFQLLNTDAENSLKRAWHKLERGLRIGRLREYVSRETERVSLNQEDSENLFKLLIKALDKKVLNSKASVTYNMELQQITEIKGLVSHSTAAGTVKYQILDKKPAFTQKRRMSLPPKEILQDISSESKNETPISQ